MADNELSDRKIVEGEFRPSGRDAYGIKLADVLRPLEDPRAIQAEASRLLGEELAVSRVFYATVEDDGATVTIEDNDIHGVEKLVGRFGVTALSPSVDALCSGKVRIISDAATDPGVLADERARLMARGVASVMVVPLVKGGRWVANMGVDHVAPRVWTEEEISLLRDTAERTWDAVERARAKNELRRDLDAMQKLHHISSLFLRDSSLEELLHSILEAAISIAGADAGSVQVLHEDTSRLHVVTHVGLPDGWLRFWSEVEAGKGSCGTALRAGGRVVIEDVAESPVFAGTDALENPLKAGIRAVQSTPLMSRSGNCIGMISTHWSSPHRPPEKVLHLLDLVARHAADIVERMQANHPLRDVTEQRRIERELQGAIETRDEMLSVVAHDLRNPLGVILMQAALLRRPAGLPERRSNRPVERIQHAAARMNRTVDDLLDVSRLEAGLFVVDRARASVQEILAAVVEAQEEKVSAQHLDLHVPSAGEMAVLPAVWGDKERVLQIFDNLIDNAVKFTKRGSITIRTKPERDEIVFSVTDTGSGISPEDAPHVFDRFWQARKVTRAGTGLGLAVVKGIVEANGGRVRVESELGRGSTFFFTLPVAPSARATEGDAVARSGTVLLAEDDDDMREDLVRLLESRGHRVVAVANGQEAVDWLRREPPPTLMILDLGMPVLDGWGVLAEREQDDRLRSIPAVVVSGQRDVAQRVHAANASFLAKPFVPNRLIETVEAVAQRASKRADT